jgi:agmatine deiminase
MSFKLIESLTSWLAPGPRRLPGEFEPHQCCVMAWPHDADRWPHGTLAELRAEITGIAAAVSAFEPVLMYTHPSALDSARAALPAAVELVAAPLSDVWTRDTGPLIALSGDRRLGLHFTFNGWGGRFPSRSDAALPRNVCDRLGLRTERVETVLEGGAVLTDGQGTLITTEECLLNPNRNPGMTKADYERVFARRFGVTTTIWLPYGAYLDTMTDGHVDEVVAYVRPGVVMCQTAPGGELADRRRLAANFDVLERATDARGRRLELIEMPYAPPITVAGSETALYYLNFYLPNGGVVVPVAGSPEDEAALAVIKSAFPDRTVVPVPARILAWGGGGIHCTTQQIPADPRA